MKRIFTIVALVCLMASLLCVAVFAAVADGKLNFAVAAGADAVKAGAHAGNILREIATICGGKGGGRPDSAMGGGRDIDKIPEALLKAEEILSNI